MTEVWNCDIEDVVGLGVSKSKLSDFTSLGDMVETNSREMIDFVTERKLQENLLWSEIKILRPDPAFKHDWFERQMWDGGRIVWNVKRIRAGASSCSTTDPLTHFRNDPTSPTRCLSLMMR
jgi:Family of unknown function (DUF6685)